MRRTHGLRTKQILSRVRVPRKEDTMTVLGLVLLVVGFVANIAILWTLGLVVLIVGVVLGIAGHSGHQVAGRKHWY